jgi:MFS family permease
LYKTFAERIGINRVVLALSVARLGDAVGNSILFVIIPLYVAKLPAPWFPVAEPVRVGLLIALYGLVNVALQPVMGALSDRLGKRKPLILGGLIIMALSTFLFIFASRFTDLLLLRALQGIGVALTIPASLALMATATTQQTRGGSMGVYSTMRMLGFAIGPLLGGLLYDTTGFNVAFVIGAAAILIGVVLVQVLVDDTPPQPINRAQPKPRFRLIDRSLLTTGLIGAALASFVISLDFSMLTAVETQVNQRLNQTALAFGFAFSALMFSRLIVQVPLGRLSDRVGRKPLIIAGLLVMAPATGLLGVALTTAQLTWLCIFQGIASAAVAAPAFALAADVSKAGGEGRQMSVITMGFGLGIALGPLMAGLLVVAAFELPFFVGGLISIVGAWVVLRYVPETIGRQEQTSAVVRERASTTTR